MADTDFDLELAEKYIAQRQDNVFRWGSRCLRGGGWNYNPCVLDRPGWENYYLSQPLDYDVRNDPVFNLHKSSYNRLGDLGFTWPEPSTKEALRTGYCGPDTNSLTRPAFLRFQENDRRPEPAFRSHLTDRAALHLLRADPLEGVLPFGRQGDMLKTKSVMHRDYKWRRSCCAEPPSCRKPTYEQKVHRFCKTDLDKDNPVDQVVKFDDDNVWNKFLHEPLLKLKRAYNWPINPITREPLGGRLLYYKADPCIESRDKVWPCGKQQITDCNPKVIPDQRCELLAHGPKKETFSNNSNWGWNSSSTILDMRFPRPNWECWEEVPDSCKSDLPAECCFCKVETKGPPIDESNICPRKPPCPTFS